MLILPPGHADSLRTERSLTRRERRLLGAVLAGLGAIAIIIVIALITAGRTSSAGCIYLTIPAATGAEEIYQCGATARSTCASAATPGAFSPQAGQAIARECRKAGVRIRH